MTDTTGTVKYFKEEQGYGFIAADNSKAPDWFFHFTNFEGEDHPPVGLKVKFEEGQARDGRRCAIKVRPVEPKPAWAAQSRAPDAWWTK